MQWMKRSNVGSRNRDGNVPNVNWNPNYRQVSVS